MSIGTPRDAWTQEVRRAALVAVRIAAAKREAGDRTLSYFLRSAMAHGLTLDDLCRAGNLSPEDVLRLTDPAVA